MEISMFGNFYQEHYRYVPTDGRTYHVVCTDPRKMIVFTDGSVDLALLYRKFCATEEERRSSYIRMTRERIIRARACAIDLHVRNRLWRYQEWNHDAPPPFDPIAFVREESRKACEEWCRRKYNEQQRKML